MEGKHKSTAAGLAIDFFVKGFEKEAER